MAMRLGSALRMAGRNFEYLVVGGGNAAGYVCREFAQRGVGAGRVGVISGEVALPYERPALTKAYLHPPAAKVRARLPGFHTCVGGGGERQTAEWYAEKGISFIHGQASGIDFAAKSVNVGAERCSYDKLILATGARPLRLGSFGVPGDELENVFYIREEPDAAALVAALEQLGGSGRAVIVGGGYIGMECGAALVGWGMDTTMVFPESHCMPRLFNVQLAEWLERQYEARGVKFIKGTSAGELIGRESKVSGVRLSDGQVLSCDVVVVGVGAAANVELAAGQLDIELGGFRVDGNMQTSAADVYAVGDVCTFPSPKGMMRCEHVDHARKSAAQAVQAAMGLAPSAYSYLPYFYSRIFEYTESPIVFNFYGDSSGECSAFPIVGKEAMGAIWVTDNKVAGALLMGSPGPSAEDQAKLRELVLSAPPAGDGPEVFARAGL